jgi:hypothetical protein
MPKANTNTVTFVNANPRTRMKEIRNMVAKAHKQGQRIDLMGFTGDDIARSQIALQDLLTKEQMKHAKAREHILDYKEVTDTLAEVILDLNVYKTTILANYQDEIKSLKEQLDKECNLHNMAYNAVEELTSANVVLTTQLEDTMNTLRIALNGGTHA